MINFNPTEQNDISRAAIHYQTHSKLSTKVITRPPERMINLLLEGLVKKLHQSTPTHSTYQWTKKGKAFIVALAAMNTEEELENMILIAFEKLEMKKEKIIERMEAMKRERI